MNREVEEYNKIKKLSITEIFVAFSFFVYRIGMRKYKNLFAEL